MKKTRILSVLMMIIAVVLIISGYTLLFVDEYKADAEEKNSYASLIKTSFTSYNMNLEEISNDIKNLDIFNEKYYAEIKNNYNTSINKIKKIEDNIIKIKTESETLIYECQNRDYNDYDIENKCETIEYNYEAIVNAFISIKNKYNDKIDEYNNWIVNQKNMNTNSLEKYQSSYYNEYIDINQDGEYSGIIK